MAWRMSSVGISTTCLPSTGSLGFVVCVVVVAAVAVVVTVTAVGVRVVVAVADALKAWTRLALAQVR